MNVTHPLRIAVVSETYPPEINGVARTIGTMVRELHRRNHSIQLIRPRQHAGDHGDADAGINTILVRSIPLPRYGQLRIGLPARRMLLRAWKTRRPDIVQVVTEGPLGQSAVNAARQLGIPIISEFHTDFRSYSEHYGLGLLSRLVAAHLRRLHNCADCTLAPTAQMKDQLAARGYRHLQVVGRGIDTSCFGVSHRCAALRRSWGASDDDLIALYVGRIAAEKNLRLFVEAAHAMRSVTPQLRVVVVGDGPELAALRASEPTFLYVGRRSGEDLARHYASADAMIFPSLTETFGNVTTEALASGLAVVAFDYAAARQYIGHRRNGLLAPFGQANTFVELTQDLAADPVLRQRLRAAAPHAVHTLTWAQVVDDLEAIFRQTIAQAATRPARHATIVKTRSDHAPL
ncbi:MAG TPA: glycosyltransferase family 1 protein [Burkholderiales bacterium]|jgi:Glycosyltransferase